MSARSLPVEGQSIVSDGRGLLKTLADALQHIETQNPSGVSSADFTEVFASDDGFDRYVVFIENAIPSSTGNDLRSRFSPDGGSSWDSGASDYAFASFRVNDSGSTATISSSGDSQMQGPHYTDVDGNASGAIITIADPTDSNRATIVRDGNYLARNAEVHMGGGIRLTQSAIDSIQFFFDSGNISSGTFSVYGVSQ